MTFEMNKKRWIAVAIVAVCVIGALGLVKLYPFWVTLSCLGATVLGFIAGYLCKNPEIITKVEEVIKEVPVTKAVSSKKKPTSKVA